MIAGLLIGYGLFYTTGGDNLQLGIVLALVGVSHLAISAWGHKKFVGKGLMFSDNY